MQFLTAGEALKRLEKLSPGLLAASFPDINWNGTMGFRDVIAIQILRPGCRAGAADLPGSLARRSGRDPHPGRAQRG
jgi:hypothetical protein